MDFFIYTFYCWFFFLCSNCKAILIDKAIKCTLVVQCWNVVTCIELNEVFEDLGYFLYSCRQVSSVIDLKILIIQIEFI